MTLDNTQTFWYGYAVAAVILGVICSLIYQRKGHSAGAGFLLGLALGLIGLVIVTLSKPAAAGGVDIMNPLKANPYVPCPYCRELMLRDARVCPHCRRERPAASFTWEPPSTPPPPPPLPPPPAV
jgi:hypothetical protein